MFDLVILGGGYAGTWAAMSAARAAADGRNTSPSIALVSDSSSLTARVRLYEHSLPPAEVATSLHDLTETLGIAFEQSAVRGVTRHTGGAGDRDEQVRIDLADGRVLSARALVLSLGSRLSPATCQVAHGTLHDIDTATTAANFWAAVRALPAGATVQVLGGGFTGIELACDLVGWSRTTAQPLRVRLIDKNTVAAGYAVSARESIRAALDSLAIEVIEHVEPQLIDDGTVQIAGGERLQGDLVVYCGGLEPHPMIASIATHNGLDRDLDGRLVVTPTLQLPSWSGVFAAGDVAAARAEGGERTTFSCQHALSTGTCAGHNAVQWLAGRDLAPFRPARPYGTCLDLGPAGALLTQGFTRELVSVGAEVKATKEHINRRLVVPPIAAGRDALFAAASLPAQEQSMR